MEQAQKSDHMEQAQTSGHKRSVIIAVDHSKFAEKALDWYLEEFRRETDFLVLVNCPEWLDLTDASPAVADRLIKEMEEKVEKLEKKFMGILQERGVHLSGKFRTGHGKPGEVVCRIAEEEQASIIVCGTRGQGTIRRTIMGSVSDYIVHHSHVPVLICRH